MGLRRNSRTALAGTMAISCDLSFAGRIRSALYSFAGSASSCSGS